MTKKIQTENTNSLKLKILASLVLQTCFTVGSQKAKSTRTRVAQFVLGSRANHNIYKRKDLKHLLLKIGPFLENLFRANLVRQWKYVQKKVTRYLPPTPPKDISKLAEWKKKTIGIKIKQEKKVIYYKAIKQKKPIKVLFATTTPHYEAIVRDTALACQMMGHGNRWFCGYITAGSVDKLETTNWHPYHPTKEYPELYAETFQNQEAEGFREGWHKVYKKSHKPTLAIIPDICNNDMIWRELKIKNVPIIGIITEIEKLKIDYPIYGNPNSIYAVHFLCHLLSHLIAKAYLEHEYKEASHTILNRSRYFYLPKHLKPKELFSRKRIMRKLKEVDLITAFNTNNSPFREFNCKKRKKKRRKNFSFKRLLLKRRAIVRNAKHIALPGTFSKYSFMTRLLRIIRRKQKPTAIINLHSYQNSSERLWKLKTSQASSHRLLKKSKKFRKSNKILIDDLYKNLTKVVNLADNTFTVRRDSERRMKSILRQLTRSLHRKNLIKMETNCKKNVIVMNKACINLQKYVISGKTVLNYDVLKINKFYTRIAFLALEQGRWLTSRALPQGKGSKGRLYMSKKIKEQKKEQRKWMRRKKIKKSIINKLQKLCVSKIEDFCSRLSDNLNIKYPRENYQTKLWKSYDLRMKKKKKKFWQKRRLKPLRKLKSKLQLKNFPRRSYEYLNKRCVYRLANKRSKRVKPQIRILYALATLRRKRRKLAYIRTLPKSKHDAAASLIRDCRFQLYKKFRQFKKFPKRAVVTKRLNFLMKSKWLLGGMFQTYPYLLNWYKNYRQQRKFQKNFDLKEFFVKEKRKQNIQYKFATNRVRRQITIGHDIMWQKLYFNSLVKKNKRARIALKYLKPRRRKSYKYRGRIRMGYKKKSYYFFVAPNITKVHKFLQNVTKIKTAIRNKRTALTLKLMRNATRYHKWRLKKWPMRYLRMQKWKPRMSIKIYLKYRRKFYKYRFKSRKYYILCLIPYIHKKKKKVYQWHKSNRWNNPQKGRWHMPLTSLVLPQGKGSKGRWHTSKKIKEQGKYK